MPNLYRTPNGTQRVPCPTCGKLISVKGMSKHEGGHSCAFRAYWQPTMDKLNAEIKHWKDNGFVRAQGGTSTLKACGIEVKSVTRKYAFEVQWDSKEWTHFHRLCDAHRVQKTMHDIKKDPLPYRTARLITPHQEVLYRTPVPDEFLFKGEVNIPPDRYTVVRTRTPVAPYWAVEVVKAIKRGYNQRKQKWGTEPANLKMRKTILVHGREVEEVRQLLEVHARLLRSQYKQDRGFHTAWLELLEARYREDSLPWFLENRPSISGKKRVKSAS